MGTRPGSLDPGMLLWLLRSQHLSLADLDTDLEKHSGLLGMAGSSDMSELVASSSERAALAVEVYLHRLVGSIASMAAAMNGMDTLVFTGGVGENSASIRSRVADRLAFMGVAVDRELNESNPADVEIAPAGAGVHTLVVQSPAKTSRSRGRCANTWVRRIAAVAGRPWSVGAEGG